MRAVAFAPGHISGFFEPVYHEQDVSRSGSRGAGVNVSLGAISEVFAESSTIQDFEIYVNGKKAKVPVVKLALKYLLGDTKLKVLVRTKLQLPIGQGFGMSAAGALSATLALAQLLEMPRMEAMKSSHFAEVQLRTGLGDVMASSFGGFEIRREAGLPPWGVIEHIPGNFELVLCVVGKRIDTKKILIDPSKVNDIVNYGRFCTKRLLDSPSVENFFSMSQIFTKKTNLADKRVLDAIDAASQHGVASMCMLGNSVFALGDTKKLCHSLSNFGKIFVCTVDESGARVI